MRPTDSGIGRGIREKHAASFTGLGSRNELETSLPRNKSAGKHTTFSGVVRPKASIPLEQYSNLASFLHQKELQQLHPALFHAGEADGAQKMQAEIGRQKFNQKTVECVLVFSIPRQCVDNNEQVFYATNARDSNFVESMRMPEKHNFALKTEKSGEGCHKKALCNLFEKMFRKLKTVCGVRNGSTGFEFQTRDPLLKISFLEEHQMILFALDGAPTKYFTFTLPCEEDKGLHGLGHTPFSQDEAMVILDTLHGGLVGTIQILTNDSTNSVVLHAVRMKLFV